MMRPAAIYARVSSDRQKEDHTIASQTQAVMDYATAHGYLVPPDWIFEDEGVSGAVLVRPALEAVRDLAAQGQIEACPRSRAPPPFERYDVVARFARVRDCADDLLGCLSERVVGNVRVLFRRARLGMSEQLADD